MSVMPRRVTYMAQPLRNANQDHETFHKFFECWIVEQNQHLEELVSASKQFEDRPENQNSRSAAREELEERILRPLVARVIEHYEHYYWAKSRSAKNDILSMFSPSWTSTLEDAFFWIGGWRPSMAFHLLYSKSGMQLEAGLAELIRGLGSGDLGDLSQSQLEKIDELQRNTIREEKEISEKQAKQQETVADSSMVELSHVMTELLREGEVSQINEGIQDGRVEEALAPKEEALVDILQMADELRLKTLKEVLNILTPIQGVHFLIAAAELHLRVHEWGKKKDARHGQNGIIRHA